eukprot:4862263-Prymnesium_polylepis.1
MAPHDISHWSHCAIRQTVTELQIAPQLNHGGGRRKAVAPVAPGDCACTIYEWISKHAATKHRLHFAARLSLGTGAATRVLALTALHTRSRSISNKTRRRGNNFRRHNNVCGGTRRSQRPPRTSYTRVGTCEFLPPGSSEQGQQKCANADKVRYPLPSDASACAPRS